MGCDASLKPIRARQLVRVVGRDSPCWTRLTTVALALRAKAAPFRGRSHLRGMGIFGNIHTVGEEDGVRQSCTTCLKT